MNVSSSLTMSVENNGDILGFINKGEVKLFDTKEDLCLYSYENCDNTSHSLLKKCRGLIFDNEKNLLMPSFPYVDEYVYQSESKTFNEFSHEDFERKFGDLKDWFFVPALEGTVIRMFFHSDRWWVCTNKKLDAYKSKWGSTTSFGEYFEKAISKTTGTDFEIFKNSLEKEKKYIFLLRPNSETRVVSKIYTGASEVLHLSTFNNGVFEYDNLSIGIPVNIGLLIDTFSELVDNISTFVPEKSQGVLCFNKKTGEQIKIYNEKYYNMQSLRGNQPSIMFRYLQVRQTFQERDFITLYSEHKESFDKYENALVNVSTILHYLYIERYVKKNYMELPPEQHYILKQCHSWYLNNRDPHPEIKVTREKVLEVVNAQPATVLNKLIKAVINL